MAATKLTAACSLRSTTRAAAPLTRHDVCDVLHEHIRTHAAARARHSAASAQRPTQSKPQRAAELERNSIDEYLDYVAPLYRRR